MCVTGELKCDPAREFVTHTHYYTLTLCGHTKSTHKYNIDDPEPFCIMYLLNRKIIFGERYQPKKNFVSSKIQFSFLFGSFGAILLQDVAKLPHIPPPKVQQPLIAITERQQ